MGTLSLEEMMLGFDMLGGTGMFKQTQNGSQKYITCDLAAIDNYLMNPGANMRAQQQHPQGLFGQMQQMQGLGLTQQEQLNQQWRAMLPMQPMQCGLGLFSSALSIGGPEPRQTAARPTLWKRFVAWAKRPSRKPFMRTERRFLGVRFYR